MDTKEEFFVDKWWMKTTVSKHHEDFFPIPLLNMVFLFIFINF